MREKMIDRKIIDQFIDYVILDSSKQEMAEMELKADAPISAIIAFDEYKSIIADAKKRGIEI